MAAALAGLAYVIPKFFQPGGGLDFKLIWLAGKLWSEGKNPYGEEFLNAYLPEFGAGPNTHFWVYPPYWFPISTFFAHFSFGTALWLWGILNIALLITGTYLIARCCTRNDQGRFWLVFGAALFFVCTMQATAVTASIGQTSVLVYFGFSCLLYGISSGRVSLVALGLTVLALKPNIGLFAFLAVAMMPKFRIATLFSGALCLVSSAVLVPHHEQIAGFLKALAKYYDPNLTANGPANLVGLIHFLPFMHATAILAAGLIAMIAMQRRFGGSADDVIGSFPLFVVITLFFTSLHSYDLVALGIPFMALIVDRHWQRWAVLAGLLICYRSGNLALSTGLSLEASDIFPESTIASVGTAVVLLGLLLRPSLWEALSFSKSSSPGNG